MDKEMNKQNKLGHIQCYVMPMKWFSFEIKRKKDETNLNISLM